MEKLSQLHRRQILPLVKEIVEVVEIGHWVFLVTKGIVQWVGRSRNTANRQQILDQNTSTQFLDHNLRVHPAGPANISV
uniref:Uncharacterized protein n=1 Tax=Anguilla anguilla TaxID=7936 RepID=A0A0E9P7Z0_ANGAN